VSAERFDLAERERQILPELQRVRRVIIITC
jgi:hypothetical protein